MVLLLINWLALLLIYLPAKAAPMRETLETQATAVSTAEMSALQPFTLFAAAAYRNPKAIRTWSCGSMCYLDASYLQQLTPDFRYL